MIHLAKPEQDSKEFDTLMGGFHFHSVSVLSKASQGEWAGLATSGLKINSHISEIGLLVADLEKRYGPIDDDLHDIHWIIIRAETGNRKCKIEPRPEWVEGIRRETERLGIPAFLKDNLRQYCIIGRQQFPEAI